MGCLPGLLGAQSSQALVTFVTIWDSPLPRNTCVTSLNRQSCPKWEDSWKCLSIFHCSAPGVRSLLSFVSHPERSLSSSLPVLLVYKVAPLRREELVGSESCSLQGQLFFGYCFSDLVGQGISLCKGGVVPLVASAVNDCNFLWKLDHLQEFQNF